MKKKSRGMRASDVFSSMLPDRLCETKFFQRILQFLDKKIKIELNQHFAGITNADTKKI